MQETRIDGVVSLWVGVSPSQEALEDYVDIDYSSTVSPPSSGLAHDFRTGFYDHDFMDTSFHETPTRSLTDLLSGCSYDSLITPKFVALCGPLVPSKANSVVLLYNFRHSGSPGPAAASDSAVRLRYMGSITVEMPWPD